MPDHTGEERRHSPDIGVLIARLEVKLDALQQALTQQMSGITHVIADHEQRLRELKEEQHGLMTREDYEAGEAKREERAADRQRRTIAWVTVAVAVAVPIWIWIAGLIERQL